ncbi:MAG: SPOR domain-containing protein [Moraxellaceae bacterium]
MNNYLLLLLRDLKTIIIPGLGALTLTNEATNELLFMPFLKYDDGTLSKYIAEKEGMEVNDAKNLIAKFVREVMAELDKGEQYDMYQFGSFSKVNNEIVFKQWETKAPALQEEKVVIEETKETTVVSPEVIPEQEKVEADEDHSLPTSTVISQSEIDRANKVKSEIEKEEVVIPSKAERFSEPEKEEEKSEVKNIPAEKVVEPIEVEPAKKPIQETSPAVIEEIQQTPATKKKSKWVGQLIIGVIVLFLSAGTYIAVNFNTLKKDIPFIAALAGTADTTRGIKTLESKKNIADNIPAAVEKIPEELAIPVEKTTEQKDVSHKETLKKVVPKKASKPISKVVTSVNKKTTLPPPTLKQAVPKQQHKRKYIKQADIRSNSFPQFSAQPFQLIAGSFSSEQHAITHANKLTRKGVATCTITEFDGKYRISIGSAETKEDALNQLLTLKKLVTDAWVFEVK